MIASTQSTVAYMNETAIAGWRALGYQGRLRLLRPVNGGRVFMEARYALLYLAENGTAWEVVESFYFAANAMERRDKERAAADPSRLPGSRYSLPPGRYQVIRLAGSTFL